MSLEQDYKKLNDKIEKIIAENQKKIVKEYKKSLEELRTEIRQMYDRYDLQEDKLTLEEVAKYDRLQKLDKKVEDTYKALYEHNRKITKSTLENVFKTSADGSISPIEAVTGKKLHGITKTLEIEKTVNERMAGLHWAERLGHHRNDVIYATQKTLKEGLAQGSTYRELSDRLKTELEGNVIQPMRIIRTESGRVYAKAQQESLDKVSKQVDMVKTWHTAKDERVRGRKAGDKTNHVDMEGQTVLYEEDFVFPDGTQTEAPRMSGVAGHDIHCRCWMSVDLAETVVKDSKDVKTAKAVAKDSKDVKTAKAVAKESKDVRTAKVVAKDSKDVKTAKPLTKESEVVKINAGEYNKNGSAEESKTEKNKSYKILSKNDVKPYQTLSDVVYEDLKANDIAAYKSVKEYTSGGYASINDYLATSATPKENPHVENINRAIKKFELEDNITVYRGTKAKFYTGYAEGDTFESKVFYSSSTDESFAKAFYADVESYGEKPMLLEIRVPSGTKCIYVGSNSAYEDEKEFLLSHELKYKVIARDKDSMVLEVVEKNENN